MATERVYRVERAFTFGDVFRLFRKLIVSGHPALYCGLDALQYETGKHFSTIHHCVGGFEETERVIETLGPVDGDNAESSLVRELLGQSVETGLRLRDVLDDPVDEADGYRILREPEPKGPYDWGMCGRASSTGYRGFMIERAGDVSMVTLEAPSRKRLDWMAQVFESCFPSLKSC